MPTMYPTAYTGFILSRESATPAKSGLYMESLGNGISIEKIADIVHSDWTVHDFIDSVFARACVELETELITALSDNGANFQSVSRLLDFMQFAPTLNLPVSVPCGLKIVKSPLTPYSTININKIYVMVDAIGQIDVSIRNEVFAPIQTYVVDAAKGFECVIDANIVLNGNVFYITIDTPNIATYQAISNKPYHCAQIIQNNKPLVSVVGYNGAASDSVGYGLRLNAGLECSITSVMTALLPSLKQAVLYKGGELLQWEFINSQRTNGTTVFADKEAGTTLAYAWRSKASSILKSVVKSSLANLRQRERFCLACEPRAMFVTPR